MPSPSDYAVPSRYAVPEDGAPVDPRLWVQAAEDGAAEIEARLRRMLALSELSAGEQSPDRAVLQRELDRLRREIDRIADDVDRLCPPGEGTGSRT